MPARRTLVAVFVALASLVVAMPAPAAAAPPPGDDVDDAITVTSLPFDTAFDTSEATAAADDPVTPCSPAGVAATVWFEIRVDESSHVAVDTAYTLYDTVAAVFTRSGDTFTMVGCNDDRTGFAAGLAFRARAGTTYWAMVGTCCYAVPGQVGPGGLLFVHVHVVPPPVHVEVAVDPTGSVDRNGDATVAGTVRCSAAATVDLTASLWQLYHRHVARGTSFATLACGPSAAPWSVQVRSTTDLIFGPGGARADVVAQAYEGFGAGEDAVTAPVRLRRATSPSP